MEQAKYIILGNGGAACNAAMALREHGYDGPLLMVSDVDEAAFNPMLGPYYLKGIAEWTHCYPYGADFYRDYRIDTLFGSGVAALDAGRRVVTLQSGATASYEKCLIATGASAAIPPVKGLRETSLALPLRDSASTTAMAEALQTARKVVVMGASLVGVKLAEILRKRGAEVLLVDVAPQVMPRGAHAVSATYLQHYFEQNGIGLRLNCAMREIMETGDKLTCVLPEEVVENVDFVAICTGIRSNIAFVDKTQVDVDLGILIDENSQTSIPGLYAAGDCAQGLCLFNGTRDWMGTWSNACYQGRAAGVHMAGGEDPYASPLPQHVSPFFDWTYVQMGNVYLNNGRVRIEREGDPFNGGFKLLVYNDDVLVGANLFNDMGSLGIIKRAVNTRRNYCSGDRCMLNL